MRKEYAHARDLARAQANLLRAYDEIKMATMRLQLRESEDDTAIYALSLDELDAASVQNTNDKFLAQSSLLSIKGKLRYLKVNLLPCCCYWPRDIIKCTYKQIFYPFSGVDRNQTETRRESRSLLTNRGNG